MGIILIILAFILLLIGLIGSVFPVVPGPPISYLGLLLMKLSGYGYFSSFFLWMWAGIVTIITVMDYLLPSLLTKKFGGSRAAVIGSTLGLILGLIYYPPFGMVIGSFLGAFIGELIHNNWDGLKAFKAALGSFLAFLLGSGAKLTACILMLSSSIARLLQN